MLKDGENVKDNQRKEISIRKHKVIRAYEQKSLHLQ